MSKDEQTTAMELEFLGSSIYLLDLESVCIFTGRILSIPFSLIRVVPSVPPQIGIQLCQKQKFLCKPERRLMQILTQSGKIHLVYTHVPKSNHARCSCCRTTGIMAITAFSALPWTFLSQPLKNANENACCLYKELQVSSPFFSVTCGDRYRGCGRHPRVRGSI